MTKHNDDELAAEPAMSDDHERALAKVMQSLQDRSLLLVGDNRPWDGCSDDVADLLSGLDEGAWFAGCLIQITSSAINMLSCSDNKVLATFTTFAEADAWLDANSHEPKGMPDHTVMLTLYIGQCSSAVEPEFMREPNSNEMHRTLQRGLLVAVGFAKARGLPMLGYDWPNHFTINAHQSADYGWTVTVDWHAEEGRRYVEAFRAGFAMVAEGLKVDWTCKGRPLDLETL